MTPEDRALLKAAGLKPEGYISTGNKFYAVPAEPEPTTPTTPELTSTTKGAFGRSFAANTGPALVGVAAGAVVGSALTATGVGAPIGLPLLGAAAAGAGAAYGASKLQEPLLSDEFKQQLAADQEQHPIASALGGAAPNLISARPTGLTQLAKAGRGVLGSVDPVARAAAKELAINTGVNVGTGMGMRALTDQDVTDGIGLDAALGVLMGGRPHTGGIGGKFNRGVDALSEAAYNVTPSLTSKPKAPFVGLTTQGSTEEELAGLIAAAQADKKPAFEAAPAPVNLEARAKLFTGEDIPQPAYSDTELKQYLKDITAAATKAGGPPTADELTTAKNNWIARKEAEAATKAAVNRATNLGEVEPLATVGLKPELADYYPGALNKLRRIVKEGAKQNTSYTLEEQQMLLERMATNEALKADTAASKLKQAEFEKANKELAKAEKAQAKLEAEAYKARDEQKQRELDALQAEAEKQNAIREANSKKILDDEIKARNEEFTAGQTETGNFLREAFDAELKPKLDNAGVSQLDRIYAESRIGVPEGMKSMLDAIYSDYKAERVPDKTLEVAKANLAEAQAQPEQAAGATEGNWQRLKRNELLRQQVTDENAALAATGEPADVPAKQQDAVKAAQAMQDRLRLEREVAAENRNIQASEENAPNTEDQPLTQGMYDLVANFYAPRLGIKVRKSYNPVKDKTTPGIPKGVIIDNKDVAVTPKATQDVIFHEALGHGFMNMARAEEGTALRKQADRLVELAATDSKYLAWKAEAEKRIAEGKLSRGFDTSPEEYVAQVFGVRLAKDLSGERYVSPKLKYQTDLLFKELKRVMGKASADDMFSLIQEAMVNGATPRGRVAVSTQQNQEEGAPEVPYKSNIARMVEGMKQEKFTKGQLEAEIRKNRSTIEEYDYRGLNRMLPEKLDKATVLRAVEEVAPKIERVNFTDKVKGRDPFNDLGLTREEFVNKYLDDDGILEYRNDPAAQESYLKALAVHALAAKQTGFIANREPLLKYLAEQGNETAAKALTLKTEERADFLRKYNDGLDTTANDNTAVRNNYVAKSTLNYDPKADERLVPYWTSNPNRSETTLKIPGADYVGKPRSKEHFSNDTFGWIRTSEGALPDGTPVKLGEEFQSDVTKDFRKRSEKDEELIRRGEVASHIADTRISSGKHDGYITEELYKLGARGQTVRDKTLATTPYLKSESRLLLKQLLLEADRDGFNHIAWTTGEEQAKRNRREGIEDGKIGWKAENLNSGPEDRNYIRVTLRAKDKMLDRQYLTEIRDWVKNKADDTQWSRLGVKPDQISEILARIKRGETSGTIEVIPAEGYHNIYDREVVAEAKRLGLNPKLTQMSDGTTRWVAEVTPKAREESRYAFSEEGAPRISSLSSIVDSPGGAYVEEKLRYAQMDNNALNGKYLNQALKILLNAKNPDLIYKALIARRHGEAGPTLSAGQEMVANRVKALLTSIHDEQRSRGLLVQDYENGKPVFREAKDDPNYIYEVPSAKVYDTLTNRPESPEAKKLVQDFIDFKTEQYGSKEAAQEALDRMIPRKGGGPRLEYNAARLSEGAGLPASWRETDFVNATRRYFNRMAADLAYYKNIQSDPAMRQLLNIKSDGTGENAPKATKLGETDISNVDYSNHPDVIGALEDMMGGRNLMPVNAHAINRLAKTLMIGIPGKLRDFVSSPFIAMEAGGAGTLKHLPKALANLSEGMNEVINRGLADVGRDAWFNDTLNDAGTFSERVNKLADQAGAIQGLPQLEQASRGLTWLLGKYTAQSKLGDKAFMKQWGPKEAMSTEDTVKFIADRITESVQGTYDFRSVPTWMRNSSIGSVFALSKWSVGRYKNFQEHVLRPAKNGDLKPLLTAGLGIFMGSAAIDALNELIKDKKPEHLTWDEWLKLGIPETGYRLATAVSSSGVAGILGDLALNVYQKSTGKSSQEFGIPVIGLAEKLATRIGQMAEAERLDLPKLIHLIAKDNIQTYRDAISGFEPDDANAKRDFRVYDRITNDRSNQFKPSNPFLDRASEMTPAEFADSKIKNPGSAMMIYDRRNPGQYDKFLTAIGEGDQTERRAIKQYLEDEKERGRRMVRR